MKLFNLICIILSVAVIVGYWIISPGLPDPGHIHLAVGNSALYGFLLGVSTLSIFRD